MEFDNTLDVPLAPAEAWRVLLDIKRIATCIPGAELTEVVDQNTYKGRVAVRLGPVALSLAGQAQFEAIDHASRKARVKAHGADPKGRGGADTLIEFRLEPAGDGTRVLIHSNISLAGSIAQYGRGSGMIQSVAGQLIAKFGENLKVELARTPAAAPRLADVVPDAAAAAPPAVQPIGGFALLARATWHWLAGWFGPHSGKP